VHVSDAERRDLEAIADAGVEVAARDLPDAHSVSLSSLLGSRWKSSS